VTTTWSMDAEVYTTSALAYPALSALNKALVAAGASATTMDALRVTAQSEVVADLQRAGDAWSVGTTGTTGASGTPYPILGSAHARLSDDFALDDTVDFRSTTDVENILGATDRKRLEIQRVLCTLFRAVSQKPDDTYGLAEARAWDEYHRLLGTLFPTGGLYQVG